MTRLRTLLRAFGHGDGRTHADGSFCIGHSEGQACCLERPEVLSALVDLLDAAAHDRSETP